MAQIFTHLLAHVIFSTKRRRPLLKAEIKPRLFSGAPAGLGRASARTGADADAAYWM